MPVLRKNPNIYSRKPRRGDVEALMRRINALEAGVSGGAGYVASPGDYFNFTFPNPPSEFGVKYHGIRKDANEIHICQQTAGINTFAVLVFDLSGTYIRQYCQHDSLMVVPNHVGIDANGVCFITMQDSIGLGSIVTTRVFSATGTQLASHSGSATTTQQYLGTDSSGNYFISNYYPLSSFSIKKYNSSHSLVATFGTYGSGAGQAKSGSAGRVAADGDLYVFDYWNSKVLRYTTSGTFVSEFSTASLAARARFDESDRLHSYAGSTNYVYETDGTLAFTFYVPNKYAYTWLDFDSSNNMYAEGSSSDDIIVYSPTGSYSQTTFSRYAEDSTATSLGTPDGGVSVPATYALSDNRAWLSPQHIVDMRTAIEAMAANFTNPNTSNAYNFTNGSADNLYYNAMGDRKKYGGQGPRYTWTRTFAQMINTPTYDIDIGEIHECVSLLEAA